jgi:arsenate reductase (glutaredoxin)
LTAEGVDFETVNYIEDRLSAHTLKQLLRGAGLKPQDAIRTKEPAYRQHVAGKDLSDEQLIQLMTEYPELLQRPIVLRGSKAVLARPVEKLRELGIK